MRDWSLPKEFEEEQFKRYPVYSGEGIEIVKDDFGNIIIETSNYGVTLYFEYSDNVGTIVIHNRLTKKLIFLNAYDLPDFMKPLLNFSELKCEQDIDGLLNKFFNLKAFL